MDLKSYLSGCQSLVNEELARYLADNEAVPSRLKKSILYSLQAGGKRIRPVLVFAGAQAVGGSTHDVLPVACALEMIHTFSLIHDDLPAMDDDDLRRGKPTNHKIFGEGVAVLAGDGLLADAFLLLASQHKTKRYSSDLLIEIIEDIACATGPQGMVGGQALDLEGEGKTLSLQDLEKIHRYKTGALIEVSVVSGAKLSGANEEQLAALGQYGKNIGLAFQIADDVLSVAGEESEIGKRIGNDEARNKSTYPALLGLEASKQKAAELIEDSIIHLNNFGERANHLRGIAGYIIERTK